MAVKRAWVGRPQFFDSNGDPLNGGKIFWYAAGSSTKQDSFNSSSGSVANSNPMVLDAAGRPQSEVWLTAGVSYKLVLTTSSDGDPPTSPIWTEDNITGINDTALTFDEWNAGPAPTFVSSTSFTVAGDQTSTLTVGRRVKIVDSGGTKYGTIKTSVFTTLTTVTLDSQDSDALATPTSSLSYGLFNPANSSHPIYSDALAQSGDASDRSKRVRHDAGNVAAATTRVITWPDGDVTFFNRAGFPLIGEDSWLYNASLAVSVAANALTVALKTKAGADPSATDPVYIGFRNATLTTGDYTVLKIVAAASLVVSSGSTLGTVSTQAHRIYIVGVNDGGTLRLGVWNPWHNTNKVLLGIDDSRLYSSTAEGGAGAADSAQVLYTGAAVTSKPVCILGYFESTQTTAGTWAAEDSKVQVMEPGIKKTGDIVQTKHTFTGAVATGTTVMPLDDTIPQNTEGDEYMTLAVTPTSLINLLKLDVQASLTSTVDSSTVSFALFQDSTAGALAAVAQRIAGSGGIFPQTIMHTMLAGTESATTFKMRAGPSVAATVTFNGTAGGRIFGGVMQSYMRIQEIFV